MQLRRGRINGIIKARVNTFKKAKEVKEDLNHNDTCVTQEIGNLHDKFNMLTDCMTEFMGKRDPTIYETKGKFVNTSSLIIEEYGARKSSEKHQNTTRAHNFLGQQSVGFSKKKIYLDGSLPMF